MAIDALEANYSGLIRSYYLFGSHADGTATEASDVDLFLVSYDPLGPDLQRQIVADLRALTDADLTHIDALIADSQTLLRDGHFRIKHGSQLLYGDDIRERLPEQTDAQWLRHYAEAPLAYSLSVLRGSEWLTYPLMYPDPNGEFFGYDSDRLPPLETPLQNIKALVATALWISTITVAIETGQRTATKAQSVNLYQTAIGDEWSEFLQALYHHGKECWGYHVPASAEDRQLLRSLCERMLAFENQFFARQRDWLLVQLRSEDVQNRRFALSQLSRILFPDPDAERAVRSAGDDDDAEVRRLSQLALDRL